MANAALEGAVPDGRTGRGPRLEVSQPLGPANMLPGATSTSATSLPVNHAAGSREVKLDELSKYFHLPEKSVAKELGICLTSLKKLCRSYGITRWPFRWNPDLN
jgi:hypothetical protein